MEIAKHIHNPNPDETAELETNRGIAGKSALGRIPPEIFAKIFINCSFGKHPTIYIPFTHDNSYPWYLGHVCSEWRGIVWGTSYLWQFFQVADITKQKRHSPAEILRDILLRTTANFSVVIITEEEIRIISALIPFVHRVNSVEIRRIEMGKFQSALEIAPGLLQSLTALALRHDATDVFSSGYPIPFDTLPHLQSLSLHLAQDFRIDKLFFKLSQVPWRQLTTLSFTGMIIPMRIIHGVLKGCVSIIKCTLPTIICSAKAPGTGLISLPFLKILEFMFYEDTESVGGFIDPLVLPSLQDLTMTTYEFRGGELCVWSPFIIDLVLRSGCGLKSLCVCANNEPVWERIDRGIEALMEVLPSLEMLTYHFLLPPSFFEAIQNRRFLPRLKKIGLCCLQLNGLHALLNLLDSYLGQGGPSISSGSVTDIRVLLEIPSHLSEEMGRYYERRETYNQGGIRVSVEYTYSL